MGTDSRSERLCFSGMSSLERDSSAPCFSQGSKGPEVAASFQWDYNRRGDSVTAGLRRKQIDNLAGARDAHPEAEALQFKASSVRSAAPQGCCCSSVESTVG